MYYGDDDFNINQDNYMNHEFIPRPKDNSIFSILVSESIYDYKITYDEDYDIFKRRVFAKYPDLDSSYFIKNFNEMAIKKLNDFYEEYVIEIDEKEIEKTVKDYFNTINFELIGHKTIEQGYNDIENKIMNVLSFEKSQNNQKLRKKKNENDIIDKVAEIYNYEYEQKILDAQKNRKLIDNFTFAEIVYSKLGLDINKLGDSKYNINKRKAKILEIERFFNDRNLWQ